jgi:hypothetical protein
LQPRSTATRRACHQIKLRPATERLALAGFLAGHLRYNVRCIFTITGIDRVIPSLEEALAPARAAPIHPSAAS